MPIADGGGCYRRSANGVSSKKITYLCGTFKTFGI
jgi:hypothetical protein